MGWSDAFDKVKEMRLVVKLNSANFSDCTCCRIW